MLIGCSVFYVLSLCFFLEVAGLSTLVADVEKMNVGSASKRVRRRQRAQPLGVALGLLADRDEFGCLRTSSGF